MCVCAATGVPEPTFQWFKDGRRVMGATTPVLRIHETSDVDVGEYSVDVTNEHGTVNSNIAKLHLAETAPVITLQPSGHAVKLGDTLTLNVHGGWFLAVWRVLVLLRRRWRGGGQAERWSFRVVFAAPALMLILSCVFTLVLMLSAVVVLGRGLVPVLVLVFMLRRL
jgi:hypothetical protein